MTSLLNKLNEITAIYLGNGKIPNDSNDKNLLLVLHSIGRDGMSLNALQLYSIHDMNALNDLYDKAYASGESKETVAYTLQRYAKGVSEIINDILPYVEAYDDSYAEQLFGTGKSFEKFLLKGIQILNQMEEHYQSVVDYTDYFYEEMELSGFNDDDISEIWDGFEV